MRITLIEKSPDDPSKLQVYVDNQFSFLISELDFMKFNLYEKEEIALEEMEKIKKSVCVDEAKSDAVRYLSYKMRTEKEVRQKLVNEGYVDEIIEDAISQLKSMGYINDLIYAQKFLYDRSKIKPQPRKRLKLDLQNKGVDDGIIDSLLDEWELDEAAMAESIVKRKFGKYNLQDEKIIRRVYSFLVYRGFDSQVINDIMKSLQEL